MYSERIHPHLFTTMCKTKIHVKRTSQIEHAVNYFKTSMTSSSTMPNYYVPHADTLQQYPLCEPEFWT